MSSPAFPALALASPALSSGSAATSLPSPALSHREHLEDNDSMFVDFMEEESSHDRMTMRLIGHPRRQFVSAVLFSTPFDSAAAGVILANLVAVIHEANLGAANQPNPLWLAMIGNIFLALYVVELLLKLFAWGMMFFEEWGNCMDFVVVAGDVLMTLVELVLPQAGLGMPSFSTLRVLRLLRLVRLLRAFKVFRRSRELSVMLAGMASAFRAIFYGLVLIAAMLLLWSIVAVEVLHPLNQELAQAGQYDDERSARAYESVSRAFATFLQQALIADDWSTISMPLILNFPLTAGPLLIAVFCTTQLALLNLMLTAIVDSAQEYRGLEDAKADRRRSIEFQNAKQELFDICRQMDTNQNGALELKELLLGYDTNSQFQETLGIINVDRDDISMLYRLLDADGDGRVSYSEFLDELHSMKMEEAKTILFFVKSEILQLKRTVNSMMTMLKEDLAKQSTDLEQFANVKDRLPTTKFSATAPVPSGRLDFWELESIRVRTAPTPSEPRNGCSQGCDVGAGPMEAEIPLPLWSLRSVKFADASLC